MDIGETIPNIMQRLILGKKKTIEMLKIPLQKAIINLHRHNISYKAIAEQLQIGESTIKRLLVQNTKIINNNSKKALNISITTYTFLPTLLTANFTSKKKEERNIGIILDYIRLNLTEDLKKVYHCGRIVILRVLQQAQVNILNSQAKLKILNTMNIKNNSNSDKNEQGFNLSNPMVIKNFQQARNFFHVVQYYYQYKSGQKPYTTY